jgi:threonylcarbamoyladenosine tRNA methylthiotransferase MtaB
MRKTVHFQTVGCRLNQYETEKMAAQLEPYGFERVDSQAADLYVINTCTVTHRADRDSRYYIRRALRENPDTQVVVVGCYVEHEAERVAAMEGVDVLIFNDQKDAFAAILTEKLPSLFKEGPITPGEKWPRHRHGRNRAWMKISDGCSQRCTFCLVTKVRGDLVNRPAADIIEEIEEIAASGFNEVVLTGVNIGYYADKVATPPLLSLPDLVATILRDTSVHRIRLSSIEPQTVTDELVRLCATSGRRMCRHLHIPMQSGSTRILKLMKRPYDRDTYLRKLESIKQAIPDMVIGADVIVGFPGESDQDFQESVGVAESGLIDYLHVFSYSDRPGTDASEMPGKVPSKTTRDRQRTLSDLSEQLLRRALARQVGQVLEVIPEAAVASDGHHYAVADNFVRVRLDQAAGSGKSVYRVRITDAGDGFVHGHLSD